MAVSRDHIAYYDFHVNGKLRAFLIPNPRVERAWRALLQWAPAAPNAVGELGCAVGETCWRLSCIWPGARVYGVDISPASLAIARKLFGSERVSFLDGPLDAGLIAERLDYLVLMDVYEHIPPAARPDLHAALATVLSAEGRVFLSFPTPRHNAYLRAEEPEAIQPVDEDITPEMIMAMARDTHRPLLYYEEVDVWHRGDYAYAVLGANESWERKETLSEGSKASKVDRMVREWLRPWTPTYRERARLIEERLGPEYLEALEKDR